MDVQAIRDGLQARLATIAGLRPFDVVPGEVPVPAAIVVPEDPFIDYLQAMQGGAVVLNFRITLLAGRATDRTAQDLLDQYLSAGTDAEKSVFNALRGDKTLGGAASDCIPFEAGDYGTTDVNGTSYYKADVRVRVHATRS